MAHIEDRWFKTITGPDDKKRRVKTSLHGKGLRYRVRYIDPNGKERAKSFPDKGKHDAEDFLVSVENAKRTFTYIDPEAGNIGFADQAEVWLCGREIDTSTRQQYRSRITHHLVPYFERRPIKTIRPEDINGWNQWMKRAYGEGTRAVSFVVLKSIFEAAVDNQRIPRNPCSGRTVAVPKQRAKKVEPWPPTRVKAVRRELPERYQATIDIGSGCGSRQGEIFGLGEDDFDFDGQVVHVRRQIKAINGKLVFGLPKNDREHTVPLPASVARSVQTHMAEFPPVKVTLPWEDPESKETLTVALVFTDQHGRPIHRRQFDSRVWGPALKRAGIPRGRQNGMHALRHLYASLLIAAGVSIKIVASNLDHVDPAFTLRIYAHLLPDSDDQTRTAIDRSAAEAATDEDEPHELHDGLETA